MTLTTAPAPMTTRQGAPLPLFALPRVELLSVNENDIPLELDIRFAVMYSPEEFAQTFAHLAAGDLDVAPLLTGIVGMDEVADAFDRLGSSPSDAKILLDPQRGRL
jgi:threonine dehydrogenase-like Zn-dependent dehydrogenase